MKPWQSPPPRRPFEQTWRVETATNGQAHRKVKEMTAAERVAEREHLMSLAKRHRSMAQREQQEQEQRAAARRARQARASNSWDSQLAELEREFADRYTDPAEREHWAVACAEALEQEGGVLKKAVARLERTAAGAREQAMESDRVQMRRTQELVVLKGAGTRQESAAALQKVTQRREQWEQRAKERAEARERRRGGRTAALLDEEPGEHDAIAEQKENAVRVASTPKAPGSSRGATAGLWAPGEATTEWQSDVVQQLQAALVAERAKNKALGCDLVAEQARMAAERVAWEHERDAALERDVAEQKVHLFHKLQVCSLSPAA